MLNMESIQNEMIELNELETFSKKIIANIQNNKDKNCPIQITDRAIL